LGAIILDKPSLLLIKSLPPLLREMVRAGHQSKMGKFLRRELREEEHRKLFE
jgi:hypothetical protein